MISQIAGLNQQIYTSKTSEENAQQGTTSVIASSAKLAFEGLAAAIGWTKSVPPQEKVLMHKKSDGALREALSCTKLTDLSNSLALEDSDSKRANWMAELTGKPYQSKEATGIENYAYDILMIAELPSFDREEERNRRLKGLDKIGAGNTFTLLAVASKHAESLAQDPNLSKAERAELLMNKQFLEKKLMDLLARNPESSASVRSGDLRLNLEQVDSAFMNQLENQKNLEEKQSDVQESRFNRIFAIAVIALTIGSAAAASYSMYRSHQATVQPKAAPAAPPPAVSQQTLPEDMCQGPDTAFCQNNYGIPRIKMPQLDKEVTEQFLKDWTGQNVTVTQETVPADSLYPTQGELLTAKVQGFVKTFQEKTFNPCKESVIVAQRGDDHVLDGHHRWAACKILKESILVKRIDRPISDLLAKANSFQGVEHQGLHAASKISIKA